MPEHFFCFKWNSQTFETLCTNELLKNTEVQQLQKFLTKRCATIYVKYDDVSLLHTFSETEHIRP
jgi:hypothetical protein